MRIQINHHVHARFLKNHQDAFNSILFTKTLSGVAGLDTILRSGYFLGRATLLHGDTGTGKTILGIQLIAAESGKPRHKGRALSCCLVHSYQNRGWAEGEVNERTAFYIVLARENVK